MKGGVVVSATIGALLLLAVGMAAVVAKDEQVGVAFDARFRTLVSAFACSVTSAKRSYKRNMAVGGASTSLHLSDLARDVVLDDHGEASAFVALATRLGFSSWDEQDHIHVQEALR